MYRAIYLASLGLGKVEPNPMVGAVLVHDDRIIGEGFHRQFGGPHAEVHAVQDAIHRGFADVLKQSTLYVTLEPCSHYGKTPPCSDLIIQHGIPHVIIGTTDPFPIVNGSGIEKLKAAGVRVETGFLEKECAWMNRRFLTAQTLRRPHVTLKFAQTEDGFMAPPDRNPARISSLQTDILVHQWRTEEQAILVGTNTARLDNPRLNARLWKGRQPVRLVIDRKRSLPKELNLFDQSQPTIVFNEVLDRKDGSIEYIRMDFNGNPVPALLKLVFDRGLHSVLVEGGAWLLEQFILSCSWDEARIITSKKVFGSGLSSPLLNGKIVHRLSVADDQIVFLKPL